MKTDVEYKFVYFQIVPSKMIRKKTKVYNCINSRSRLQIGIVKWYGPWRQYCFFPSIDTWYNGECQLEIGDFLIKANKNHKKKKRLIKRKKKK